MAHPAHQVSSRISPEPRPSGSAWPVGLPAVLTAPSGVQSLGPPPLSSKLRSTPPAIQGLFTQPSPQSLFLPFAEKVSRCACGCKPARSLPEAPLPTPPTPHYAFLLPLSPHARGSPGSRWLNGIRLRAHGAPPVHPRPPHSLAQGDYSMQGHCTSH